MNIPNFIIEKAGALGIEERGKFFSAVIAFSAHIERKKSKLDYRLRKKQEKQQAMQQQAASNPQPHPQPQPESQPRPQSEPESLPIPQAQKLPDARADEDPTLHPRLSRRDRRKLMREEAKKRKPKSVRLVPLWESSNASHRSRKNCSSRQVSATKRTAGYSL